ncbi:MAG: 4Fe-4S dicluster domain-containing protein [Clostridiales bacterium]|nr:4Fe-4S dicluster domain-containing protein [Clostridiales bacterium]
MSIAIDKEKCRGCGKCEKVCPGTLIATDEQGKAYIKYPKDCWGCSSCIKECSFGAIALYLGADIGGMGSRMTVATEGDLLNWNIEKTDGTVETIVINKKESNKY